MIEFLENLVGKFNPSSDADHFGLITFNKKAQMVFKFASSEYHEKAALMKKIGSEPIQLNFQTRTDLALKMARDELFTEAGGDRPDKPNVMIVLTDGKPTHPNNAFDFEAFADDIAKDFKVMSIFIQCYIARCIHLTVHVFCSQKHVDVSNQRHAHITHMAWYVNMPSPPGGTPVFNLYRYVLRKSV